MTLHHSTNTPISWDALPETVKTYLTAHAAREDARAIAAFTADAVDVVQRLEGNFPGGVADLHFRFFLDGGLIGRLVMEP